MTAVAPPGGLLTPWLDLWGLTADGAPFTTRFGSHLCPVRRGAELAMLKIASHEEERRGAALMDWWGGEGAARVLARQDDALLMERVSGSRSLATMALAGEDDEATTILCAVAAKLHAPRSAPPPPNLVPLNIWFSALWPAADAQGGVFATAAAAARRLLADPRDPVVLHGDLHHDNVLDGETRGWLAIDPKGVLGERAFDFANLFRNPTAASALAPGRMARRADIVATQAGLDRRRLLNWVHAYAGLGAAWSLSSGQDPQPGLALARRADSLSGATG
jgi:streptomycin 6-kinase